jgi:hypothetical protein
VTDGIDAMAAPLARSRPAPARARRRWVALTAGSHPERVVLAALFLFATLVGVALQVFPDYVSISAMVLPVVMGGLFLGPRQLPWFVVYTMVLLTLALPKVPTFTELTIFTTVVVFVVAFIVMLSSFRRSRLGIAGAMGE